MYVNLPLYTLCLCQISNYNFVLIKFFVAKSTRNLGPLYPPLKSVITLAPHIFGLAKTILIKFDVWPALPGKQLCKNGAVWRMSAMYYTIFVG